jgi:prephenate dehydrogenase
MLIIGGTGDTGQWFVKFFKNKGFDITVWGKNKRLDIAEKLGVPFAENLDDAIQTSDIVMVSVPINHTEEMIAQIAPKMKTGSLLMDITSIKTGPVRAMEKYTPKDVEYLGTHPMFGPSIQDIRGQTVILTPTNRCKKWLPIIEKIYRESGAHIELITPQEHDEIMRVVQGLTHYAYIAIGTTLQAINFDVTKSRRFMSPVYEIMLDFVGRILAQNPYLYAMIQTNPGVTELHDTFIKECSELSNHIKKGDTESFVKKMKQAAAHFKNTESAQRRSDKLINNKITEYEKLTQQLGRHCAVKHLYTGKVHTGTLTEVTPLSITLEKNNKNTTLKIENIKLLTPEEYLQWRKEHEPKVTKDISAYIPPGANPEILKQTLQQASPEITHTTIIDTYRHNNKTSITFRITMLKENHKQTLQKITQLLQGIGCTIR